MEGEMIYERARIQPGFRATVVIVVFSFFLFKIVFEMIEYFR